MPCRKEEADLKANSIVDVHLLIWQGDKLLLQLRQNTGYGDGSYHLPAGHLEEGETVLEASCREALEELGIVIASTDLNFNYLLHQHSSGSRIGLFFGVNCWSGVPKIQEPDKCEELAWFSSRSLPTNMIPYARHALKEIELGRTLGVFGWS